MITAPIPLNPFSLMMEPDRVLKAMERSTELRHLRRRTLRPLDKPAIPYSAATLQAMQDDEDEGNDARAMALDDDIAP